MKKTGMLFRNGLCLLLLFVTVAVRSQNTQRSFEKDWQVVDSLILQKDLTRSALDRVHKIHDAAVASKMPDQVIKATLYRMTLEDRINTEDPTHRISLLKAEVAASTIPAEKAILHSLLAKQYLQYLNVYRWQLYNRTDTKNFAKDDINTWTIDDLLGAITSNFRLSLQPSKQIQQTSLESYDAVILKGNQRELRPTLFDLLAHEALEFFENGDNYSTKPSNAYIMNDPALLKPAATFMRASLQANDSSSPRLNALSIYKDLLQFHSADADKNAFVTVDLERLQWVFNASAIADKERLYENTLNEIASAYPNLSATRNAWLQLANIASNRAGRYNAAGDTSFRYDYLKALDYISRGTNGNTDTSVAAGGLRNLRNSIIRRELRTEVERVNVPGKPMRALLSYRNTDSAFIRIIPLTNADFIREKMNEPDYWSTVVRRNAIRSFYQKLPSTGDYQLHSTEIKMDALPIGEYALLVSSGGRFDEKSDKLVLQSFYVSNISYIRNGNDFFVLNRETGQPLPFAKVAVINDRYITATRKRVADTIAQRSTDQNGHFRFEPNPTYYSLHFFFTTPKDTLNLRENDYVTLDNQVLAEVPEATLEQLGKQVFFFTDRGIYRPGQTVEFKGIALTRNVRRNTSKLQAAGESGFVYLFDANHKKIDSLKAVLNSYGSFSARFQLPATGLTGSFMISAPAFGAAGKYFRVEDYKRPLFSVKFEPLKTGYRLNDSVAVTGSAKAFAGNNIDGATVSYDIIRNVQYPMPWLIRMPVNNSRVIAKGTAVTDADGKFLVKFRMLADDIVDSAGNPIFNFTVTANVTDKNGETHSASTVIRSGYKSIQVQVSTPAITTVDSVRRIHVVTSNYSNEPVAARVQMKLFPLQAPDRPVRKRYWQKPDQYVMTKAEFLRNFPTDEYENETNYQTWPTGNAVMEKSFSGDGKNDWDISAHALAPGYYKWEVTAIGKDGAEIKQSGYFQVFDKNDKRVNASLLNFNYADKQLAEPGETVNFYTGIPADKTFVITRQGAAAGVRTAFEYTYLNKGINTITYPVTEKDRGDIAIAQAYVYDNRVYANSLYAAVPWTNKTLKVNYATYRNLTEPGAKEKWTVTVQGNKSDSVAAELLTGMYDASLDQFMNNTWSVPNVWQRTVLTVPFNGQTSFNMANNLLENYIDPGYYNVSDLRYDRLATSGADLWNEQLIKIINDPLASAAAKLSAQEKLNASQVMDQSAGPRTGKLVQRVGAGAMAPGVAMNEALMTKSTIAGGTFSGSYNYSVRGANPTGAQPLYVVDGVVVTDIGSLNPASFKSISVLTPAEAQALYGAAGVNGAVVMSTGQAETSVKPRTNLAETAFFFPQLYADSTGKFTFSFTMPEGLTQWKWQTVAHTRDLAFGVQSAMIVTQKKLMVQPNAPRFLREGDNMDFSGKIVNLSDKEITGQASLELVDPETNTSVDGWFQNVFPSQYFTIGAGQSAAVKFPIQIPFSYNKPLTWRLVARSSDMSDGEENTLPVLTNRVLVTETLPLYMPNDSARKFTFDKLLHSTSESLTNESITVEYTSNPVWYAVQALPYLIDYPYECAEQTFNRYYANTLAGFIVNKNPKLRQVFEQWKADSSALLSNLQKNQELKQLLLQETPWVMQAESEAQQKKNLALLFDLARLNSQSDLFLKKLAEQQTSEGGFSWFKGGNTDRYITNYILTGIGKLKRLGALPQDLDVRLREILVRAVGYMDANIANDYETLLKYKADLSKPQIGNMQLEYLYMRSFFRDLAQQAKTANDFYLKQSRLFWVSQNSYYKAMTGLIAMRNNDEQFARGTILPAILENASSATKLGMYWKSAYTGWWYQSPVEHQSLMIAFVSELNQEKPSPSLTKNLDAMKTWLLLNKQTNNWRTTIATADACYALLLNGSDWLNNIKSVSVRLGNTVVPGPQQKVEAGTGYFKTRIDGKKVDPAMGNITVSTSGSNGPAATSQPSWGAVYWQYFEDMDKVTAAASPLSLRKNLFIEKNTSTGKLLQAVADGEELKVGDKVVVRIELRSDRDMDYLHLKDMRAAAMEPVNVLSGYKWQGGIGYYESTRDASTNFFIDHLRKGTYVFEYPLFITHGGVFSAGIATIQCMYAPEFTSHSAGIKLRVATQ